ncbi:MFS transporter [Dendrothele bispora CBS 962.96]|uniref:MFS transporter n=1 Tax=Dendrothele bispora (strain CBS 962.96) TaxID=1314807 RepID=A0A4S8M3L9_DENBC|nr:MFS transporter [Dendrothele bispora CBS 962.96]
MVFEFKALKIDRKVAKIFLIAVHTSLAGLLYGLDTGSIGPVTEMNQFTSVAGVLSPTVQGIYVSCILLSASVSSLSSGWVADIISRKYGILCGAVLSTIGSVLSASSQNLSTLFIARIITGLGMGQAISVVTVYLCEIAPANTRGTLACMIQLLITIGVAAGYFITFGTATIDSEMNSRSGLSWRLPFVVQAIVAVLLAMSAIWIPFSPRWLVERGRKDDTIKVLRGLRDGDCIEKELKEIDAAHMRREKREDHATIRELFEPRYIKRNLLGIFLMSFQQLTGIDTILYYAPIVFQQAGFSSQRASFLASGITGIINFAATIPAQIWIDKMGRKPPLLIGGAIMSACFLVIGALYATLGGTLSDGEIFLSDRRAQLAVVVLVYVFVASFACSWAVVGKIYACEIIPTRLRAKACAVQQLSNWLVNFTVALTAPAFLKASPSGPYFLYGSCTLFTVLVCFFAMPETKEKSLEEIEAMFSGDSVSEVKEEVKDGELHTLQQVS